MDNNEIKKALEGLKDIPAEYPPPLKTARRAEWTTMVKKLPKKKPGCPFAVLMIVFKLFALVATAKLLGG